MRVRLLGLLLGLLLLAVTTPAAAAQVFTTQVAFRPYFGNETVTTSGDIMPITDFTETHPDFPAYVFTGQAHASGTFASGPVLRATTRVRGTQVPHTTATTQPFSLRTNAVVTYIDMPTVLSPVVPFGDPITVTMTYSITGFFTNETITLGPPLPATGGATMVQNQPSYNFGSGPTFASSFSVANGALYDYSLSLFVHASGPSGVPSGFVPDTYSTAGLADFSNTVTLTDLSFTDGMGMTIPATMTSLGGMTYAAVPEPSALALLGLTASVVAARRLTRRKS